MIQMWTGAMEEEDEKAIGLVEGMGLDLVMDVEAVKMEVSLSLWKTSLIARR